MGKVNGTTKGFANRAMSGVQSKEAKEVEASKPLKKIIAKSWRGGHAPDHCKPARDHNKITEPSQVLTM